VRYVGSVILAAVLSGVPRALDARVFGSQRSVYVEVASPAPELTDLTAELKRAIGNAAYSLASQPSEATLVVELLGVATSRGANGRAMEAASFVVRDGERHRPIVLHYPPGQRAGAARALLESLSLTG
jgi:hypothetical protein